MGLTGLEPVTLRLSSACSNQLSYRPALRLPTKLKIMIWNQRFEVVTRKRAFLNLKPAICNLKLSGFRPPHPDELLVLTRLDLPKAGPLQIFLQLGRR